MRLTGFYPGIIGSLVVHSALVAVAMNISPSSRPQISLIDGASGGETTYFVEFRNFEVAQLSRETTPPAEIEKQNLDAHGIMPTPVATHIPEDPRAQLRQVKHSATTPRPQLIKKSSVTAPPQPVQRTMLKATFGQQNLLGTEPTQGEVAHASSGSGSGVGSTGTNLSSRPGIIKSPRPPYPAAARRDNFEGALEMAVLISDHGEIEAAELLKSSGREDCDQAALTTIKKRWRFEPALRDGYPVAYRETIRVSFELQ